MSKTLLVGAGAEIDYFGLPSGKQFVFDTCYHSNMPLYKALDSFYEQRLSGKAESRNEKAPKTYQPLFLYSAQNSEFKKLAEHIIDDSDQRTSLLQIVGRSEAESKSGSKKPLDDKELQTLYNLLIRRNDHRDLLSNVRKDVLEHIPDDAYFGIIESYFSSLISPKRRNQSFWRLVNYYWSAFFTVAEPLIRKVYEKESLFQQLGIYQFTLSNLNDVIKAITDRNLCKQSEYEETYYGKLQGKFDNVLTTNYSGLSETLFPSKTENTCIYLSGAFWMFESLESLTARDIRTEPIAQNEFVFPFLMTQAPIKPIIDANQMRSYAKAIEALDSTNLLVVLGYSFCDSDYHIASLVHDYMQHPNNRLIYLSYSGNDSPNDIARKLRLNPDSHYNIEVMVTDDTSISCLIDILERG